MVVGTFTADITAVADDAYVRIPSYDGGRSRTGPVVWQPQIAGNGDVVLPARGDLAFLEEADAEDGRWVVVAWETQTAGANTPHNLGYWDPDANVPELSDITGRKGDYYRVVGTAARDLGAGTITWRDGDTIKHDGTAWEPQHLAPVPDLGSVFSGRPLGAILATTASGQYTLHYKSIILPAPAVLTGIRVYNGLTVHGNFKVFAADPTGPLIAASAAIAQAGAAAFQDGPFMAPLSAPAGELTIGVISDSATATFVMTVELVNYTRVGNGSLVLPTTLAAPSAVSTTVAPVIVTY